jgi:hypothetical protein
MTFTRSMCITLKRHFSISRFAYVNGIARLLWQQNLDCPQNAQRSMMDDQRSMINGQRSMVNGQRSFATGQRPALPHSQRWCVTLLLLAILRNLISVLILRFLFSIERNGVKRVLVATGRQCSLS